MSAASLLDSRVATAFFGRFPALRPIQEETIPALVAGRNVTLSAGTGSGKTEAVVAPLVDRHWRECVEHGLLRILYVAPTKALINDLEKRLRLPLASLGLTLGIRHGDRDDLAAGHKPHLLFTTPESLEVMLFRRDRALADVRAVVLDEVHLLYNTQRGLQLSALLRRLAGHTGEEPQWAALSATVADLEDVREFLASASPADLLKADATREIDAHVRVVDSDRALAEFATKLVGDQPTKLLVFVDSRRTSEHLVGVLRSVPALEHCVFAHYSSLSSDVRRETEESFASLQRAVCVATSTLELGIDIGDIDAVLLWGAPSGGHSFLQRIGRGNRRRNKSNVVCLVPGESPAPLWEAIKFLTLIDTARRGELARSRPYELYGAIVQQALAIIGSNGGAFTRVAELYAPFSGQGYLGRESFEAILSELASGGVLQRHGFKNRYGAADGLHRLIDLGLIWGNFGPSSTSVDVLHGGRCLGAVPAANLLKIGPGDTVRFAGRTWRVVRASRDAIVVEPHRVTAGAVDFKYSGGPPGTEPFVANRAWSLLHGSLFSTQDCGRELGERLSAFRERLLSQVSLTQIPFVADSRGTRYFTFGGAAVNRVLARAVSGENGAAGDLWLSLERGVNWSPLSSRPEDYRESLDAGLETAGDVSVFQAMLPAELRLEEASQSWLRNLCVGDILGRLATSTPRSVDPALMNSLGDQTSPRAKKPI